MSEELFQEFTKKKNTTIFLYGSTGTEYKENELKSDDKLDICAKRIIGDKIRYFVKSIGNRELYNPEKTYRKTDLMNNIKFISVGGVQFELYIRFLRTRQIHSLRQAQRECRI